MSIFATALGMREQGSRWPGGKAIRIDRASASREAIRRFHTLIILPAVTLLLYGLLTVVSFFPRAFNFPAEVTEKTAARWKSSPSR